MYCVCNAGLTGNWNRVETWILSHEPSIEHMPEKYNYYERCILKPTRVNGWCGRNRRKDAGGQEEVDSFGARREHFYRELSIELMKLSPRWRADSKWRWTTGVCRPHGDFCDGNSPIRCSGCPGRISGEASGEEWRRGMLRMGGGRSKERRE